MQNAPCWTILVGGGLALWVALCPGSGAAAPAPPPAAATPTDDPLALAALLLSDGRLDQAAAVLAAAEPAATAAGAAAPRPGVGALDAARYWSLVGLVALQRQDYAAADAALERAASVAAARCVAADTGDCADAVDPLLRLSQARARLLGGDPAGALAALAQGGPALDAWPGRFLVAARAHEELGDRDAAWAALDRGLDRHPDSAELWRQQLFLLVRMGLFVEAGDRAADRAAAGALGLDDTLVIGEALRKAGALDRAAALLEAARLRHPGALAPTLRLAAVHKDAGRPLAAARLLQEAAAVEPKWALAAAELYRAAGRPAQALYLNAQVLDPTEKAQQRFGLLLDQGDFERAVALAPRLERAGLVQADESLRYGLAYAWFQVGEGARADALLSGIADPRIFSDALALRAAIARCQDQPELCP